MNLPVYAVVSERSSMFFVASSWNDLSTNTKNFTGEQKVCCMVFLIKLQANIQDVGGGGEQS